LLTPDQKSHFDACYRFFADYQIQAFHTYIEEHKLDEAIRFNCIKNEKGQTLLVALAAESKVAMLDEVAKKYKDIIDPNARDNAGLTALHYAIQNSRADLVGRIANYFGDRLDVFEGDESGPYRFALQRIE